MRILSIKIQKGRLYAVDFGERTVLLDRQIADNYPLKAGMELPEEAVEQLYAASHLQRAKARCLWYLERQDYTARALAGKLYGKFEPEYIAAAVERMQELGLVNDAAYAQRSAERLLGEQGVSLRMARQKLLQKGVDRTLIDAALENTAYDGAAAALALLQKKYAGKIGTPEDVRRTYQALARRGFTHAEIKQALKQMKEDLEFEE